MLCPILRHALAAAPSIRHRCVQRCTVVTRNALSSDNTTSGPLHQMLESNRSVPVVVLKRGKARLFRDGSPVVYRGAIDSIRGKGMQPALGDPVFVCDGSLSPVGWGVYSPTSLYAVRILQTTKMASRDPSAVLQLDSYISTRIHQAVQLRLDLAFPISGPHHHEDTTTDDTTTDTNVYRLINSEGDGLSGLTVDVLGPHHLVAASTAGWIELHKTAVLRALAEETGVPLENIIWRRNTDLLRQDGLIEETSSSGEPAPSPKDLESEEEDEEEEEEGIVSDERHDETKRTVLVVEKGVKFIADPWGQKTGFYADQRDSRAFLRALSRNRSVLDLCCYSGGFAINAALGGASNVQGVDSSARAVALATENATLNEVADRCTFVAQEMSKFMKEAEIRQKTWDIVILDPPKLAPSKKVLDRAVRKYTSLNQQAIRLVKPGGFLMTCSCSGAMTQSGNFEDMVREAGSREGRRITLLRYAGAGADHTLDPNYPEGKYLSNLLVRVD